jgi:hypothetical protein
LAFYKFSERLTYWSYNAIPNKIFDERKNWQCISGVDLDNHPRSIYVSNTIEEYSWESTDQRIAAVVSMIYHLLRYKNYEPRLLKLPTSGLDSNILTIKTRNCDIFISVIHPYNSQNTNPVTILQEPPFKFARERFSGGVVILIDINRRKSDFKIRIDKDFNIGVVLLGAPWVDCIYTQSFKHISSQGR